jgi:hypothetical protein
MENIKEDELISWLEAYKKWKRPCENSQYLCIKLY